MTVMGSITNIAKQRPDYFSRVVQAFEALQGKQRQNMLWEHPKKDNKKDGGLMTIKKLNHL